MRVWDLTRNAEGEIAGFDLPGHAPVQAGRFIGDRAAMLVYPDEPLFVTPGATMLFDVTTGEIERYFEGYGGQMVNFSQDGTLLAGQPFIEPGVLGPVHIRDIASGEVLRVLDGLCTFDNEDQIPGPDCAEDPEALGDSLNGAAFSPDATMLALSFKGGDAGIWDVESGQRIQDIGPSWFWFSPAGDRLVVTGNTVVTVYDTEDWSILARLTDANWMTGTFSHDSHYLFGADTAKGIVKLDTATWDYVGEPITVQEGVVRDIDLNSDGTQVASGGSDGVARIWDTETGNLVQEIPLGDVTVSFVHFLDDQHLVVWPNNQSALTMTIDIEELIDIARSRITRGYTDDECETYHIDLCPDLETIRNG